MDTNKRESVEKICKVVPTLDSSSREVLLAYAAGMAAQKELLKKKVTERDQMGGLLSDSPQ